MQYIYIFFFFFFPIYVIPSKSYSNSKNEGKNWLDVVKEQGTAFVNT